jgi:tetratricopeptide (TPR) repeat protein
VPDRSPANPADLWVIFRNFALATPRRVAVLAAIVVTLSGVTTGVLARGYHETRRQVAEEYFATAQQDAASGDPEQAAVHYRAALSLERDNKAYRRALAVTLIDLRRIGEAESRLDDLLAVDPIDGETNLLRGRVAAGRGNWSAAEAYYQRAIYGRWPPDQAVPRRLAARYELVDLFTQIGASAAARAELLRLQADLPDVPFLQDDAARRFMRLGDPQQAASVLRKAVAARPNDAWLAASLSAAELASGRLTEARDAARRALALDPTDHETRERLNAIGDALALDPTARGLALRERHRRSGLLLARAMDELQACLARHGQTPSPETASLLTLARSQLDAPPRDVTLDDQVTNRLALAEQVWRDRVRRCGSSDEPVAWLFDRLSR